MERLYSLSDQLKVQLEVLEDSGNPLRVEVRPVPMMMDRRAKLMSALSNLLTKLSDTASSIVQNLK